MALSTPWVNALVDPIVGFEVVVIASAVVKGSAELLQVIFASSQVNGQGQGSTGRARVNGPAVKS